MNKVNVVRAQVYRRVCVCLFKRSEGVNPMGNVEVVGVTVEETVSIERSSYVKEYEKSVECDFCKCIAF